jgi:hypothetical protein
MKHINTLILTSTYILLALISCNKDESEKEVITATAQNIEFNISYSGTAQTMWGTKHKLYFLVDYGSYTPYDNFSIDVNPAELKDGKLFTSPYKFEPGFYEISGFWDWNDSGSWDDYEPYIAPANVDITGFEQPKVNISVVDKSQPNDDGWCQGSISYSGANLGSHHIYLDISVIITGHRIDTIQVTNNPYNLLNGDIGYLTCLLSPENAYVFHFFWDINDNGAHDDGEPRDIETPIEISPGLPTIVNAELN